jgi:hypothetical protein
MALELTHLDGRACSKARPITSMFDATRRLLTRQCTASQWASHAEDRDVDFLRHHVAEQHVGDDVEALDSALDGMSLADLCRPARPEMHEHGHTRLLAGIAARRASRARDVGALPLPPRFERPEVPACGEGQRPMTLAEWRDVPSALREQAAPAAAQRDSKHVAERGKGRKSFGKHRARS